MIEVLAPGKGPLEPDPDPGPSEHPMSFLGPQPHPILSAPATMNTAILKSVPGLPDLGERVNVIRELLGYMILN